MNELDLPFDKVPPGTYIALGRYLKEKDEDKRSDEETYRQYRKEVEEYFGNHPTHGSFPRYPDRFRFGHPVPKLSKPTISLVKKVSPDITYEANITNVDKF